MENTSKNNVGLCRNVCRTLQLVHIMLLLLVHLLFSIGCPMDPFVLTTNLKDPGSCDVICGLFGRMSAVLDEAHSSPHRFWCCWCCCCWISAVLGGDPIIPLRLSWSWFGGVQSQILYPSPRKWENCLTIIKANCCWLLHNMMVNRNSGWKICNNTGLKKRRVDWFARRVAEDTLLTFVEILEILWSP